VGEVPLAEVPSLGRHTDAILAEIGLNTEEVRQLRKRGVVA
jgi:crotonobetainyl-CoA:carnitine CoA-transferase CaiB-like acyl-CoA transferase